MSDSNGVGYNTVAAVWDEIFANSLEFTSRSVNVHILQIINAWSVFQSSNNPLMTRFLSNSAANFSLYKAYYKTLICRIYHYLDCT